MKFVRQGRLNQSTYRPDIGTSEVSAVARDASSLRGKFLVQPVTAVVAPPNLSTHKPAGNCGSLNDGRIRTSICWNQNPLHPYLAAQPATILLRIDWHSGLNGALLW